MTFGDKHFVPTRNRKHLLDLHILVLIFVLTPYLFYLSQENLLSLLIQFHHTSYSLSFILIFLLSYLILILNLHLRDLKANQVNFSHLFSGFNAFTILLTSLIKNTAIIF